MTQYHMISLWIEPNIRLADCTMGLFCAKGSMALARTGGRAPKWND
jgi:hypothetical protein